MIDESALASGIYQNLSKCLALRNKYYELSLQADRDAVPDKQYGVQVMMAQRLIVVLISVDF